MFMVFSVRFRGEERQQEQNILGFRNALNHKYPHCDEVSTCFALYLEMQFISLESSDCVLIADVL